jgi:hypothetical protein
LRENIVGKDYWKRLLEKIVGKDCWKRLLEKIVRKDCGKSRYIYPRKED